ALTREGRPVGMLLLDNPGQIGTFSPEQQQLARAIGQQATIAIDNARLYQQAQVQQLRAEHLIERARAIYQVAMTVNSGEDLPVVLRLAARHLVRGLDAKDGLTLLLDTNGSTLRPVDQQDVGYTLPAESIALENLPHFHEAIATGHPLLISAEQAEEEELAWLRQFNLKNMLIVPLMVGAEQQEANWDLPGEQKSIGPDALQVELLPDAHCVGLIVVNYIRRRNPSSGQYAFAQDIAAQCALAIEKARLLDTARQAAALSNERANTLDAVFQAMTEGILVLTPDEQISIRNRAAAQFLGVPVYSSTSLPTFLQQHPHLTLDGRPLSYEEFPLTRALNGNTQMRGERLLSFRSNGAMRIIEITTTPLKDSNHYQKQIGVVGAFRDVTVQVQAEQSVHMALETFLHTAEAISYSTDIQAILRSLLAKTLVTLACARGTVHLFKQAEQEQRFELLLTLGFAAEEETRWLAQQEVWLNPVNELDASFYQRIMSGHATLVHVEYPPEHPRHLEETTVLAAPITHNQHILGILLLDRAHPIPESAEGPTASGFTSWDLTIA
ncbi:MAG: GAF domain-containing protein, partial [Ktedonobacteraceae bacterium]